MSRIEPTGFYELGDSSEMIICGECLLEDLEATRKGDLVGDEAVTINMAHRLEDDDVEPYQCDKCLTQNDAYDEIEDD